MAADLATVPSSGLRVQACGDAHLANFGGFAAPDRTLVFDMNDFDETAPGPFEWDVKRLAASFEIAARSRELSSKTARAVVRQVARSYREAMAQFADDDEPRRLVLPPRRAGRPRPLAEPRQPRRRQALRAHRRQGREQGQPQGAVAAHAAGRWRAPDRERPADAGAGDRSRRRPRARSCAWLHERYRVYRQSLQHDRRHLLDGYRLVDFAAQGRGCRQRGDAVLDRAPAREGRRRSALPPGQGSRSLRARAVRRREQVRQPWSTRGRGATPAAVGGRHPARVDACAGDRRRRTRLLRASTVGLEGVARPGHDDSRDPEDLRAALRLDARAGHARSGDRIAIAAYLGTGVGFERAIADFAAAYADQNDRDFEAVSAAERS